MALASAVPTPAPPATPAFTSDCLKGRVAVVTGAGGGLGNAIAVRLHAMGASVVLAGIEAPTQLPSPDCMGIACDIADADAVEAMGRAIEQRYGRCDILVNNAGTKALPTSLEDLPVADWDKVFDVNVRGAFLCARVLAKPMLSRGAGSIINIASIGAQMPTRIGAYGPSKAALIGLTRQMAVEWGPRGIRANSVSPGLVRTPMSDAFYRDEQQHAARVAMLPARRIGVPEDIAGVVAFLATDAAAFVTGQDIVVDGGYLIAPLYNAQPQAAAAAYVRGA
jgi:NAD(P)-dependent dehydrogenase (short-subunit alcohol dehydrogenase family)